MYVVAGWWKEPAHLVEDMKENLAWADKICIVDDRHRKTWRHEGEYRLLQREELQKAGIRPWDWVLVTSPDERWEKKAETVIRNIAQYKRRTIYRFHLKEMFTPTEYRVDGIWGRKTRPRLYPYLPDQVFSKKRIQQPPTPAGNYGRRLLDINIYHLKNIEPESREGRAEAYKKTDPNYIHLPRNARSVKAIDPEGKYERLGYDYFKDTEGIKLQKIPKRRQFTPAYTKPYIFKA